MVPRDQWKSPHNRGHPGYCSIFVDEETEQIYVLTLGHYHFIPAVATILRAPDLPTIVGLIDNRLVLEVTIRIVFDVLRAHCPAGLRINKIASSGISVGHRRRG